MSERSPRKNSSSTQQLAAYIVPQLMGRLDWLSIFIIIKKNSHMDGLCYKLETPVINSGTETRPSYSFTCNLQKDLLLRGSILVDESELSCQTVSHQANHKCLDVDA